jgi:hypothetical protein
MRNLYFSDAVRSEQNLYEDIVIEALKMYGQDVYYIPRDLVNEDRIFGDDILSKFNSSHKIEMYIENIEGFDGEGDLFTRFGVEIRDEATFVVSRKRWTAQVRRHDNEITAVRPLEGDLIYLPMTNKIFQIMHVEHEQPFYQLSNLPVFKMRCVLFEYSDEDLDTGIAAIDKIEQDYGYKYIVSVTGQTILDIDDRVGRTASVSISDTVNMNGEIAKWSDSDNKIHLIHVGADDGKFHVFPTSGSVLVGDSDFVILSVAEDNQISANEQNTDFSTISLDFLDFTEANPFGDPEDN